MSTSDPRRESWQAARGREWFAGMAASLRRRTAAAVIFVLEVPEASSTPLAVVAWEGAQPARPANGILASGTPLADAVAGQAVAIAGGAASRFPAGCGVDATGIEGLVTLPLRTIAGTVSGVFGAMLAPTSARTEAAADELGRVASRAAAELEALLATRERDDLHARCELVGRVTSLLLDARPLREQAEAAIAMLCEHMGADAGVLRLVRGKELVLLAAVGIPPDLLNERLPRGEGIAFEIENLRQPLAIERVDHHHSTAEKVEANPRAFQFKAYAGAPLLSDGVVVGILGVYATKAARKFTRGDLGQLQVIANFLALGVLNGDLSAALAERLATVHRAAGTA